MKPLIGISATPVIEEKASGLQVKYAVRQEYVARVMEAGGSPILLPPEADPDTMSQVLDGWIIPGGDDLDPSLWGESVHPEARLEDPHRTRMEVHLYKAAHVDMPILGICYGCQFINVMQGGSLHQHLPDILGHDSHRGDTWQAYQVEPGTILAGVLGDTSAEGKSWHHQAINHLGHDLIATAHHEDGTIEGIQGTCRPWLVGVQWHPERSDAEATPKIFSAFIEEARQYQLSKRR